MSYDIALVTESRYVNPAKPGWYEHQILTEDALLTEELKLLGLTAIRVDWADPTFDWKSVRMAVLRTTWDYFNRIHDFRNWLQQVAMQTKLVNSVDMIRWNLDKHYLIELAKKGVNIPPTEIFEQGANVSLAEVMHNRGWYEAVLKPCISGAGRHTYRVTAKSIEKNQTICNQLLASESMMLQEFQESVLTGGEVALMLFEGKCSHAVLKTAKPGDFRVQDDFGGSTSPIPLNANKIAFAEQVIKHCPGNATYARVDIFRDNRGQWAVSEVELIEPELWLRHHQPAAKAFAKALANKMG